MRHYRLEEGHWHPLSHCPPPDGLLLRYSVFTTLRWPLESCWLRAHLKRLERDAQTAGLAPMGPVPALEETLLAALPVPERQVVLRITGFPVGVSAHTFTRGTPLPLPTQWWCSLRGPAPDLATEAPEPDLRLYPRRYEHPAPIVKHGSLFGSLNARLQLAGPDEELLWLGADDHVCETTNGAFFLLAADGSLHVPPASRCLPSITRRQVQIACGSEGLLWREEPLPNETLSQAAGAFVGNSVQGLRAVHALGAYTLPWPPLAVTAWRRIYTGYSAMVTACPTAS